MKTHNTKQNMKCAICSGSLSLTLASIIAAAVLLFPTYARSQPSEWIIYNTDNSGIPDNCVVAIGIDPQGNVWIGTKSGGLAVYRQMPVVDFNSDGIVDCADICIMIDHWHTDYPLCDIAPTPFGDGIVDVQDLIVLAEYLF